MTTFEQMVDAYVKLRDKKKELNDAHAQKLAPLVQMMDQLEGLMLSKLQETGQENAKTKAGTVYKAKETSVTIADKEAFRRHVIDGELWELLDWKANKTAVGELIDNEEDPPPGVNYSSRITVGVRRANGT